MQIDYFQQQIMVFLSSAWSNGLAHDSLVLWLAGGVIIVVALVMGKFLVPTVSNRDN